MGNAEAHPRGRNDPERAERRRGRPSTDRLEVLGRILLENTEGQAIFTIGLDGRVQSWNVGAERLFGYRTDEVLGRPLAMFFTPEDVERAEPERELRVARETGRSADERWHVRKGGERFWGSGIVTALREDGRLCGFAKLVRALTLEKLTSESRAYLASIVESSDDAIISADLDERITSWNRGAERMYGYTAEEALGRPISMLVPRDRRGELAWIMERIRRGEPVEHHRTTRVRKDGRRLEITLTASPIRDASGRIIGASAIARDVSQQEEARRKERVLDDSSHVLASTLDYDVTLDRVAEMAVPEVADWCVIYVSENQRLKPVAVRHSDPRKAALTRRRPERHPPEPPAPIGLYRVFRTGEPALYEQIPEAELAAAARDRDHLEELRALELRSAMAVPLVVRERVLGVIVLATAESGRRYTREDIGFAQALADRLALAIDNARLYRDASRARVDAERRAREAHTLREAVEAVTATTTIEDAARQIAECALRALDADAAFVERRDPEDDTLGLVAAAPDGPTAAEPIPFHGSYAERVLGLGRSELVPRLGDAATALSPAVAAFPDASAIVAPLGDAGVAIGALIVIRPRARPAFDERDAARAMTYGRLASLAFGKVRLFEEAEARQRELERVMDSRAHLVRGFSHDIKNPLGAADGQAALLEDGVFGPLAEPQLASVRRIRASLHTAIGLVEDTVALARVEAGQLEIRTGPTDLRQVVREVGEEHRAELERKGVAFHIDAPPDTRPIESDASRIRQILGNLLSNAVKYTPPGGRVGIRVAVRPRGARGRWVAIDVTDTGPGIPEDKHEEIFREFTRLGRGAEGRGAGLGLAISRQLARALGGDLTVASQPGAGSTFTLWLPPKPTRSRQV